MRILEPLPAELIEMAVPRAGLISTAEFTQAKISSHRITRQVEAGEISRIARGLYSIKVAAAQCRETVGDHQFQRLLIAYSAVMVAGATAAAAGQSGLVIMGVTGLPTKIRPEITTVSGSATSRDKLYHNRRELPGQVCMINGVKVVSPEVALVQAITGLPRNNAVAVVDSMLRTKLLNLEQLAQVKELLWHRPGAVRVRPWLDLANPLSDSPAETFARLTCLDLGCPPDVLQLEVFDADGMRLARIDLAWALPEGRWLLGEIDGFDFHASREQLRRDRERQNSLVTSQTILRRWSGTDAMNGNLAQDVSIFLDQAGWQPGNYGAITRILI